MEDVAAEQAELALEVERRMDLAGDNAGAEVRGVGGDGVDDPVCGRLALVVPAPAAAIRIWGQFGRELLAEQAGDVGAGRGEAVVEGRGDQHLDDRLTRP